MVAFSFHAGKLAVQSKAGTVEEAARVLNAGFIGTKISSSGDSQIADPDMKEVYLSSVDREGLVWASVVGGVPGFVSVSPSPTDHDSLHVSISSGDRGFLTYRGDPLEQNLRLSDAPVGMLVMGYKNRRRYRIDGRVVSTTGSSGGDGDGDGQKDATPLSGLTFEVTMAMGNCPKYLHVLDLVRQEEPAPMIPAVERSTTLSKQQRDWIGSSATFTLGTYAGGQDGGADASNRGGNPGFVQALDDRTIVFPDYRGNNLYLSLGNIAANPRAGLLFINRDTGDVLQVSGEARIVYAEDSSGDDPALSGSTGKYVRVDVLAVIEARGANPLRMRMKELSPFSPAPPSPSPAAAAAAAAGRRPAEAEGGLGAAQQEQQQEQAASFLVRCIETLDVASGVKAFRFKPAVSVAAVGSGSTGDDGQSKVITWTPGQYATFFFPSCEGVGCSAEHQGLYTLPVLRSPEGIRPQGVGGARGDELVVRTWTITSVNGDGSPLEITVQAKEGGVSEQMHSDLKPGALVRVTVGGDFTLTDRLGAPPDSHSKVLLLSAGIGVTPMIGALRWLRQRRVMRSSGGKNRCLLPGHPDVVAIHATRSREAVPFLSELIERATAATAPMEAVTPDDTTPTRFRFVLATTRARTSSSGGGELTTTTTTTTTITATGGATSSANSSKKQRTTTADVEEARGGEGGGEEAAARKPGFSTVEGRPDAGMLNREVPDIADRHVFLCGPDTFMAAMDEALKGLGVSSSQIHSEEFYF